MTEHAEELECGGRFRFWEDWMRVLSVVAEERVAGVVTSLRDMLGTESLAGLSLLDAGSGSGLLDLVGRRLGAPVHYFDDDPHSVACTAKMRRRFAPSDSARKVEGGLVLDETYLEGLGACDVVDTSGVLHHMGLMWCAVGNMKGRAKTGGALFIPALAYPDATGRLHQRRGCDEMVRVRNGAR